MVQVANDKTNIVVYRPNEREDEYLVFVEDVNEYNQWKEDKSIALARFVGMFAIYKSGTSGHTGQLGEISKQEIENVFFADDKNVKDKSLEAAMIIILQKGTLRHAEGLANDKLNKNPTRGGGNDVRAGGSQGNFR